MARKGTKKIVFVIVEGPSDESALDVILARLFESNSVHVEVTHGDITSERFVTSSNIVKKIGDIIKKYAEAYGLKQRDFQKIIHLTDMDGAYISDSAVCKDESADKTIYTATEIRTAKPDELVDRNKRKRANLNRISATGKIWGIPYCAYYMSCNLDHVLYDKQNSTDQEKELDAYNFSIKYKDHLDEFLTFICDSEFSVCDNFRISWEYIKTGKHSLERHSNLGICFKTVKENAGVAYIGEDNSIGGDIEREA